MALIHDMGRNPNEEIAMIAPEVRDSLKRAYAEIPTEELYDLLDATRILMEATQSFARSIEAYLTVPERVEQTLGSEAVRLVAPLEHQLIPPVALQILGELVLRDSQDEEEAEICRKSYHDWIEQHIFRGFDLFDLENLVERWLAEEAQAIAEARAAL